MSTIISKAVAENGIGKWSVEVWADKGSYTKILETPGVASVYVHNGSGTHYSVEIDHRYDKQSVVDEIIRMCSQWNFHT